MANFSGFRLSGTHGMPSVLYSQRVIRFISASWNEKGVYIDDVTEKEVDSENQIYDVLETGNGARAVTKTDMND